MSSRKPEFRAPPEIYYNNEEAQKYTQNSRIIDVQVQMTERAIELLALPQNESCFILDLGCGSGLSGSVLDESGHYWIGMDISTSMLGIAKEREVEGDLILADLGDGTPFRAGSFDAAVSISALQWLCYANKSSQHPRKRLSVFFSTLYASLCRTARAVLQFYPENEEQVQLVLEQAMRAGFFGGLVIDYPNSTKAKKYFLVLMMGEQSELPNGLGDVQESRQIQYTNTRNQFKNKSLKTKYKEWILEKKERRRRQGREVRKDSKFTGRRRCGRF